MFMFVKDGLYEGLINRQGGQRFTNPQIFEKIVKNFPLISQLELGLTNKYFCDTNSFN